MKESVHDFSELGESLKESVKETVTAGIQEGIAEAVAEAMNTKIKVNANGLEIDKGDFKNQLVSMIKNEINGTTVEADKLNVKFKKVAGIDLGKFVDYDEKTLRKKMKGYNDKLKEDIQRDANSKKLAASVLVAQSHKWKIDEDILDGFNFVKGQEKYSRIIDEMQSQIPGLSKVLSKDIVGVNGSLDDMLKKMNTGLQATAFKDASNEAKDLSSNIDNTIKKATDLIKLMSRPAIHIGDLSPETVNSESYDPADSLKKTITKGQTNSLGSGTYWTEDVGDALYSLQEFIQQGQERVIYITDLAKQTNKYANINTEEGYEAYTNVLQNVNSYIMKIANVGKSQKRYEGILRNAGINNIEDLYESGKEYFSQFGVTVENLNNYINETVGYVKNNYDKLGKADINSLTQKKLFGVSGVSVGKSGDLDNYSVGSVVFELNSDAPLISLGNSSEIPPAIFKAIAEKYLANKAGNIENDMQDILERYKEYFTAGEFGPLRDRIIGIAGKAKEFNPVEFDSKGTLDSGNFGNGVSGIVEGFKQIIQFAKDSGKSIDELFNGIKNGSIGVNDSIKTTLEQIGLLSNGELKINPLDNGTRHSGGFISDDYTIIERSLEYEAKANALIPKLQNAAKEGANVATIFGIIRDEANGIFYEMQNTAKGEIISSDNLSFLNATEEQLAKLMNDLEILKRNGLFVDTGGQNILFDEKNGFSFVDLAVPKDMNKIPDYLTNSFEDIAEQFESFLPVESIKKGIVYIDAAFQSQFDTFMDKAAKVAHDKGENIGVEMINGMSEGTTESKPLDIENIRNQLETIKQNAEEVQKSIAHIYADGPVSNTQNEDYYITQLNNLDTLQSKLSELKNEFASLQIPESNESLVAKSSGLNNLFDSIGRMITDRQNQVNEAYKSIDFEAQKAQQELERKINERQNDIIQRIMGTEGYEKFDGPSFLNEFIERAKKETTEIDVLYGEFLEKFKKRKEEIIAEQEKRDKISDEYDKFHQFIVGRSGSHSEVEFNLERFSESVKLIQSGLSDADTEINKIRDDLERTVSIVTQIVALKQSLATDKSSMIKLENLVNGGTKYSKNQKTQAKDNLKAWYNQLQDERAVNYGRVSDRTVVGYMNAKKAAEEAEVNKRDLDKYFDAEAVGRYNQSLELVTNSLKIQKEAVQDLERQLEELNKQLVGGGSTSSQTAQQPVSQFSEMALSNETPVSTEPPVSTEAPTQAAEAYEQAADRITTANEEIVESQRRVAESDSMDDWLEGIDEFNEMFPNVESEPTPGQVETSTAPSAQGVEQETQAMQGLETQAAATGEAKEKFAGANADVLKSIIDSLKGLNEEGEAFKQLNNLINKLSKDSDSAGIKNLITNLTNIQKIFTEDVSEGGLITALNNLASQDLSDLASVLSNADKVNKVNQQRKPKEDRTAVASQLMLDYGSEIKDEVRSNLEGTGEILETTLTAMKNGTVQAVTTVNQALEDGSTYIVKYVDTIKGTDSGFEVLRSKSQEGTIALQRQAQQYQKFAESIARMEGMRFEGGNKYQVFTPNSERWNDLVEKAKQFDINLKDISRIVRSVNGDLESFTLFDRQGNSVNFGLGSKEILTQRDNVIDVEKAVNEYRKTLRAAEKEYAKIGKDSHAQGEFDRLVAKADELYERLQRIAGTPMFSNEQLAEVDRFFEEYTSNLYGISEGARPKPNANENLSQTDKLYEGIIANYKKLEELQAENMALDDNSRKSEERRKTNLIEINKLRADSIAKAKELIGLGEEQNRVQQFLLDRTRETSEVATTSVDAKRRQIAAERFDSGMASSLKQIDKWLNTLNTMQNSGKYTREFTEEITRAFNAIERGKEEISNLSSLDALKNKFKELLSTFNEIDSKKVLDSSKRATDEQLSKLQNRIEQFAGRNTGMGRTFMAELDQLRAQRNNAESIEDLKGISNELRRLESQVIRAGKATKSFGDILRSAFRGRAAQFATMYLSWFSMVRYIRQGINEIRGLDEALIDLHKTTSMTGAELNEFYYSANDIAKQMGVTTKEIISQAAAWSRFNKIDLLCGNT